MTLKELAASKQLGDWRFSFDERQREAIGASVMYDESYPGAGLPGHSLLMIVAKMSRLLDEAFALIEEQAEAKAVP